MTLTIFLGLLTWNRPTVGKGDKVPSSYCGKVKLTWGPSWGPKSKNPKQLLQNWTFIEVVINGNMLKATSRSEQSPIIVFNPLLVWQKCLGSLGYPRGISKEELEKDALCGSYELLHHSFISFRISNLKNGNWPL